MLFKFLNLVKVEEIYRGLKSWVDKFGMKRVSFARWTNFAQRGDNPPRCVHANPPSTVPPVDGGWVDSTVCVNTPRWISPRWTIHRGESTGRSRNIHRPPVDSAWTLLFFIVISFRFCPPGGRWTVDGGFCVNVALLLNVFSNPRFNYKPALQIYKSIDADNNAAPNSVITKIDRCWYECQHRTQFFHSTMTTNRSIFALLFQIPSYFSYSTLLQFAIPFYF